MWKAKASTNKLLELDEVARFKAEFICISIYQPKPVRKCNLKKIQSKIATTNLKNPGISLIKEVQPYNRVKTVSVALTQELV